MNRKLKTFAFAALVMAGGLMLTACTPNPAGPSTPDPLPAGCDEHPTRAGCSVPVPYPIRVVSSDGLVTVNITRTLPAIGGRLVAYTGHVPSPLDPSFPPIDSEGHCGVSGTYEYNGEGFLYVSRPLPLWEFSGPDLVLGWGGDRSFSSGGLSPISGPVPEIEIWLGYRNFGKSDWGSPDLTSIKIPVNWQ